MKGSLSEGRYLSSFFVRSRTVTPPVLVTPLLPFLVFISYPTETNGEPPARGASLYGQQRVPTSTEWRLWASFGSAKKALKYGNLAVGGFGSDFAEEWRYFAPSRGVILAISTCNLRSISAITPSSAGSPEASFRSV